MTPTRPRDNASTQRNLLSPLLAWVFAYCGPFKFLLYSFASSEMYRMSGFAAWSWSADFFGPLGMIVELGSNQMRLLKYHTAGFA